MAKDNAFNLIFKVLKKGPIPPIQDLEKIPSFMFCRFIGGHNITIAAANQFNLYNKIPMHLQYKMIHNTFAGKGIYPQMIKNIPKDESLDVLCKHYKINRELGKEYKQFISDEELDKLKRIYTING